MLNQEFDELSQNISKKKLFYKNMSIKAGIFCGILAVFFGLLVAFTLLGRKSWRTGMGREIEKLFAEKSYSTYSVGKYIKLNSTMTVNCAVYEAVSPEKKDYDSFAVIIRMPSLYGPIACVYIYESKKTEAQFIGFAQINDRVEEPLKNAAMHSQIKYWGKKIPAITAAAKEGKNEKK